MCLHSSSRKIRKLSAAATKWGPRFPVWKRGLHLRKASRGLHLRKGGLEGGFKGLEEGFKGASRGLEGGWKPSTLKEASRGLQGGLKGVFPVFTLLGNP